MSDLMEKPWRLALVVDDEDALRVAAAYYALPKKRRGELSVIAAIARVEHGVSDIIVRLEAAGLLGDDPDPPPVLQKLIAQLVSKKLR